MEHHRVKKKDLHMVFINLEKTYDRVPRDVLWWVLARKGVPRKYIDLIRDMYKEASASVRTNVGRTEEFPITIGVHQGSALSPLLFAIVMDELTRDIQDDIPWCMMFADDIVLIDETKEGVERKLELWRHTLETRGFRLSRSKTEYLRCQFSNAARLRSTEVGSIIFDGNVVEGSEFFRYLGSIIQKDGELDGDVAHRIKAGWLKWKTATGFLCDKDMPHRLKGKFYRTAIRPALLYGSECWAVKHCHIQKMSVAEMRMLRWMCGHTRKDRLRNEIIKEKVKVAPIEDKMMENRLRWFGHVRRRPMEAPVRRLETWDTERVPKGKKIILELNNGPQWKAEGSFKNGFKNKLEDILNQKFLGCEIKAVPHIESKIKWFKDKYNVLTEMFRTFGFSWDDEKHMIKYERQSYDDFCRQNKNAHGLWNVFFPYFDKLAIIYGPDRATGTNSETFAQAVDNQQNKVIDLSRDESDKDENIDDYEPLYQSTQFDPSEPVSKKAKMVKIPTDNKKQKTKKRKMPEVVDLTTSFKVMSSNLSGFMNGMNAHMSTIANALSTTQQPERHNGSYEALVAAQKLASSPSDLSLFYQSSHGAWKREFKFIINLIHPHLPRNENI
ncbi:hypothetical protein RND81_06G053100 [Saponaria officinalis]|uniref:Reverse transcriptase domain-containing protein n=1 Tax=Saponaria officinalis TaxID=3572 RepID=A0AAW1K812_SAPOF